MQQSLGRRHARSATHDCQPDAACRRGLKHSGNRAYSHLTPRE
jgi:hypothetical protein